MILLIILFILVVLISFFLAMYSMRDFLVKPNSKLEYGIFLVRNLNNFNLEILGSILEESQKQNVLVSFERLFKDADSALVIFAPKALILKYTDLLNLLELEDYAVLDLDFASVFEIGLKSSQDLRVNLPKLNKDERIWIQLVTKGEVGGKATYQMRAVIYSANKNLAVEFQDNFKNILPKIPKPYSKKQFFEFYKARSFIKGDAKKIQVEDILNLSLFL